MGTPCRLLALNERDPRHPLAGGAELHIAEIFGRLSERGYEVTLAASSFADAPKEECVDGLQVRRLGRLPFYYPRVALFCARATRRGEILLRAMARLADRFPTAELLVIGRGSAQPGLEKLADELELGDRTRFTGFVSNEERDSLLADCRVCVCASEKEGWGLTVIEANQLGTPVVASDVPGLRDSVRDGRTGLLAPYGDVEALAEGIGRLLEEDELSLDMSREALRRSHRFDWEVAASEMAEAIDRARRAA
jgi:hypothetical protein